MTCHLINKAVMKHCVIVLFKHLLDVSAVLLEKAFKTDGVTSHLYLMHHSRGASLINTELTDFTNVFRTKQH